MPQVPASAEMRERRTLDFVSVSRVRRLQKHGVVRKTIEFAGKAPVGRDPDYGRKFSGNGLFLRRQTSQRRRTILYCNPSPK
jgi:hypothetical protein